jgi:ABC-type multidrug transport system permease subunit
MGPRERRRRGRGGEAPRFFLRWEETLALSRVRTLLVVRQPEIMFWVFAFPLLLAVVLGFAFRESGPPESVVGIRPGAGAEDMAARLAGADGVALRRFADPESARVALRSGAIDVLIEPASPPLLHLQPARPEAETARLRILRVLDPPAVDAATAARVIPVEETGSRYIDFLLPGLIGLNIYGTGLWSIGFGVADARQKKLLRRLLVTPMRRSSYLASFMAFRLLFLTLELTLLTAFGIWALDVPLRGHVLTFGAVALTGAVSFAGIGMLAVARVKTIEGASGMINLATIPVWLGSGVFFSYERFPEPVQPLLRLLPLTPLNDALRAIMLDGAGLVAVLPDLAIIAGWGVISFTLALRLFRWE